MKILSRVYVIVLFVSVYFAFCQMATGEDLNQLLEGGGVSGLSTKDATLKEFGNAGSAGAMTQDYLDSGKLQRDSDTKLFRRFQETASERDGDLSVDADAFGKQYQKQARLDKIVLSAEPGDGLITLNWAVSGLKQTLGDAPLKFSLFYGTESGRLSRKVEVGSATNHRLRGLRNHQSYYVQVMGYRDDATYVSNEIKVAPLPQDEQMSSLEKSFAKKTLTMHDKIETEDFKRALKQFGYDFFANSMATIKAAENLPVGGDYILGPGDTLTIDVWGSIQARSQVEVDRNGEITIPKVGPVNVWGLNFTQAKEAINKAIGRLFKGYELNITLGKLRTIEVYVVGEVENPGVYSVSSLATVVNALSAAGGPSRNGSLRGIKVLKGGRVSQEVDLYNVFLSGDRSNDIRLSNGDTIFVPVIGPVVAVAGELKRPGIYELRDNNSLRYVLEMAGGITAAGYKGRVQVERIQKNGKRVILDYELKDGAPEGAAAEVPIEDRDMVKVFSVSPLTRQVVKLTGNVVRPGEHQFRSGMKVTDLIPNFEALLPDSYLDAATITRVTLPEMYKEVVSFNLGKALLGDDKENISLMEQDVVTVHSRWDMQERPVVSISGQVVSPGTFDYFENMTIRDLIVAAGSLKRNAYMDGAELTRVVLENGKARAERVDVNLAKVIEGDPGQNLVLQPDDALIVRGAENWLDAQDRFVVLSGEVRFPGTYSISKGEKLSSVIARAGGYTDKANLKGAKFTRKSVQELQQRRLAEVIEKTEFDILQKQGEVASVASSREELEATKASLDGLMKSVQKLKEKKAEGRVVIRLSSLEDFRQSPYDLEAMGGDALYIPQESKVVNVLGYVYNSTSFVYMPDENISYYLAMAGGGTRDAEENDMFLVKADGTVISKHQSSFGIRWDESSRRWTFGGFDSARPDPGDTLVVPQKLERIAWMREIKDITTILSQIALTAGVIVAAGL